MSQMAPEPFDTIVSVSKLRYYCPKVSYRYRISIEILNLKSISISIGIEISDIKVSISVSVPPFSKASLKFSISANFAPSGSLKCYKRTDFIDFWVEKWQFQAKFGIKLGISPFDGMSINISIET